MQLISNIIALMMIALPILALLAYARSLRGVSVPRDHADQNGVHAFAKDNGFSIPVSEKKRNSLLTSLSDFQFFPRGDNVQIELLMRKRTADITAVCFDHQWSSGLGHSRRFSTQTVILLQFNKFLLPPFTLQPQTIATKMFSKFVSNTVELPGHGCFSKKYLIRSPNEESVRALFDSATQSYLEEIAPVSLEARANTLVMYRSSVLVPASKMGAFLEEAFNLSALFTSA